MTTRTNRSSLRLVAPLEKLGAVSIVALGVFSIFFWTTFGMPTGNSGIRYVCLASGGVDIIRCPNAPVPPQPVVSVSTAGSYSVLLWPASATPIGGSAVSIPLWMAIVPLVIPAGVRFIRRALMPAGRCRCCGYDLRGLGPGSPCPECGDSHAITHAPFAAGV